MSVARKRFSQLVLLALPVLLAACGGGGGGSSGTSGEASSSSSSSSSSSGGSSTGSSSSSSSSSSGGDSLYLVQPDVLSCVTGSLSHSAKQAVLDKLNQVRARHGLLPVEYDSSDDAAAAQAALYMVANNTLSHSPSSSGKCYSSEAARLAGTSNLYMMSSASTLSAPSEAAIPGYLKDTGVSSLGHRRWVLSPFLGKVSFGRVDGSGSMASVLRVMGGERSDISPMSNDFVAYPYGNYPGSEYSSDAFLSFSAIVSKTSAWGSGSDQVSYSSASVSVVSAGGENLAISEMSANYEGYGLPNLLKWKAVGLRTNVDYTVTISNVTVNGTARQYQYAFRLQ